LSSGVRDVDDNVCKGASGGVQYQIKLQVSHMLKQQIRVGLTNAIHRQNVDLHNKQKAADVTNQSIIILLNNILPSHVGRCFTEYHLKDFSKH